MRDAAIEVDGLTKRFGALLAVDRVSFEVAPGTVFGLLGPNGAGKTTCIRILTTILRPDGGTARILGLDVVGDAGAVRHHIGLAGQSAAVDPNLTGRENLELMGRLAQLGPREYTPRTERLLAQFELAEAAGRPVRQYSGGMRRRLDVAAALVARPPVLFLDEPTTGLDPRSRNELWALIRRLVAEGTTVLLTTQYLEEADRLTDRIAVIDHGRVIVDDTAAALKARLGTTVIELTVDEAEAQRCEAVLAATVGPHAAAAVGRRAPAADRRPPRPRRRRRRRQRPGGAGAEPRRRVPPPHRRRAGGHGGGGRVTAVAARPVPPRRFAAGRDALSIAGRNLIALRRVPRLLVFSTVQPLVFVLLFRYVFAGVGQMALPAGQHYVDYLMPGVFVQVAVFGAMNTAVGLATDCQTGLLERFRSLPMARSAVLAGRTLADLARNVFVVALMAGIGFLVGFRTHLGAVAFLAGMGLVLLFGFAMSWIFAAVALAVGDPETAQAASFPVMAPLVFASSAFIPVGTMPG